MHGVVGVSSQLLTVPYYRYGVLNYQYNSMRESTYILQFPLC